MIMNTSHRPFPLPKGPWMMTQTWNDVLFAHWAVEPQSLRGIIPAALELETCSGKAWISILPFLLTNLRPRFLPPLPFISRFPELNVRTYVTYRGIPGIYFFSLDAASRLAVLSARTFSICRIFMPTWTFPEKKTTCSSPAEDMVQTRISVHAIDRCQTPSPHRKEHSTIG